MHRSDALLGIQGANAGPRIPAGVAGLMVSDPEFGGSFPQGTVQLIDLVRGTGAYIPADAAVAVEKALAFSQERDDLLQIRGVGGSHARSLSPLWKDGATARFRRPQPFLPRKRIMPAGGPR
jgi:hypothetical protein